MRKKIKDTGTGTPDNGGSGGKESFIKRVIKFIRANFWQFFRFCVVGVINTLVYYGVYYLLLQLGVHFAPAATAGTAVGIINSFIWNKLFVFKVRKKVTASEVTKFCVVYGVQYVCNLSIIFVCVTYIGLSPEIAGIVSAAICPFISYSGLRFWGFRSKAGDKGNAGEGNIAGDKGNAGDRRHIKHRTGSFILFLSKALLFFAVVTIYFIGQSLLYTETLFYFWGNIILILLYMAFLYISSRIYNGFDVSDASVQETAVSWIMCLIIVNGLQYFILSLVRAAFLTESALLAPAGFGIILAAQLFVVIPVSLGIRSLHYFFNPALSTVLIYGDIEKLQVYKEVISKQQKKFAVAEIISQHEQTGVLLDAINKVQAAFFLDVEDTVQEGLLEYCYLKNKRTYVLPTFTGVLYYTASTMWLSNTPVFSLTKAVLDPGTLMLKRIIDIFVSLSAIIITSPLMLIVWIAIRVNDNHPALYKQVRVTKDGHQFKMYKFRSMVASAEDDGIPRLTAISDPRITPVGRFIRRTRIDELPQMFNVLLGSMSIVGPRPERPEIAQMYEEIYPNFAFRTKVKAGVTGLAQIFGRYNTAPDEKLFLDIMYIETLSILQDIKLMLQTINVLFKPLSTEGIEKDSTTALR